MDYVTYFSGIPSCGVLFVYRIVQKPTRMAVTSIAEQRLDRFDLIPIHTKYTFDNIPIHGLGIVFGTVRLWDLALLLLCRHLLLLGLWHAGDANSIFWCFMISNEIFMQYSDFSGETESSKKKNVQSAPWPFPLPSRQLLPLVWPQPLRRFWEPWVRGRCVNVASLEASQLPLTQQSGSSRCEHEGFGDNTTLYRHFKLYIKFWTTKIANSVQHCSTLFLKYKNAKHFFVAYPKMFF